MYMDKKLKELKTQEIKNTLIVMMEPGGFGENEDFVFDRLLNELECRLDPEDFQLFCSENFN